MLFAIDRFNREAVAALADPAWAHVTLGDYVKARGYGEDFFNLYLVPMSSAVWSTPPDKMLAFPATTLLRFFTTTVSRPAHPAPVVDRRRRFTGICAAPHGAVA